MCPISCLNVLFINAIPIPVSVFPTLVYGYIIMFARISWIPGAAVDTIYIHAVEDLVSLVHKLIRL